MLVAVLFITVLITSPAYIMFVGAMKYLFPSLKVFWLLIGACVMIFEPYLSILVLPTLIYLGLQEA